MVPKASRGRSRMSIFYCTQFEKLQHPWPRKNIMNSSGIALSKCNLVHYFQEGPTHIKRTRVLFNTGVISISQPLLVLLLFIRLRFAALHLPSDKYSDPSLSVFDVSSLRAAFLRLRLTPCGCGYLRFFLGGEVFDLYSSL